MKILCVGAAGSGMGAIVRWHLQLGDAVYVHDDFAEPQALLGKYPGAQIWGVERTAGFDGVELIIFSDAVPQDHEIRVGAAARKILSRGFAEELGALCAGRRVIAVAGTHGKSTTTALLSWIFESAGQDPLCFIGAEIAAWHGGFRYGNGPVIVEADEYRKHFLDLHPETVLVTSLEMDHFDTYSDEKDLLETFVMFCTRPEIKSTFITRGQPMLDELDKKISAKGFSVIRFGNKNDIVYCENIKIESGIAHATMAINGAAQEFQLQAVTCPHISNVLGAIAVSMREGISIDLIQKAVALFPGILRRMERLGAIDGVPVYSDYAHHATAVRETLEICKKIWLEAKIAAIFEPHERLRTSRLREEYKNAFASADRVGLLPVYDPKGRERADIPQEAYTLSIAGEVEPLTDYASAIAWAEKFAQENPAGVIIVMGAGPVDGAFRKALS